MALVQRPRQPARGDRSVTKTAERSPLRRWREQALNVMLYVALILGALAISSSIWNAVGLGRLDLAAEYAILLVLLATVTFVRRIWFELRAGVLFGIPLLAEVVELFQFGVTRDSSMLLFAAVLLCTLLLGWRWSIAVLALSLGFSGWISWISASGRFSFIRDPGLAFVNGVSLANSWFVFLALSVTVMSAILSLIGRLTHSLQAAEESTRAAVAAREQAEQLSRQLEQQMAALQAQYQTETRLRDLVAALETSTVSLRDGVLLAPIVGALDNQRAERLMRRLLNEVSNRRARSVVLDLSGVDTLDPQAAQFLVQTTQSLRLLGCRVIITGISASIAVTLSGPGVALDGVVTARSPQQVLEEGLA